MKPTPWQLQVFAISIRKKEKWHWAKSQVKAALSGWRDARCLDVGSGVGTLGLLMEELGGFWEFTETDHAAAQETRKIVRGPVHEVDVFDPRLQPTTYNLITLFDVIEHVPDPQRFMNRIAELLAPNGTLILTTPAASHGYYFWRQLAKKFFGIDTIAHGHVVEGFSRQQLEILCHHTDLHLEQLTPFSFFFTEMIELTYNSAYLIKNRTRQTQSAGYNLALSPASETDVAAHRWQLSALRFAYPLLRGISLLDHLIPIPPGYEWGLVARKVETAPR